MSYVATYSLTCLINFDVLDLDVSKGLFALRVLAKGFWIKLKSVVWFVNLGFKFGTKSENTGMHKTLGDA